MRTLSLAMVGFLSGAGVGSLAIQRRYFEIQRDAAPTSSAASDFVDINYIDIFGAILKTVFQRPSSRLDQIILAANQHDRSDIRFEAVRLLATYWRQWRPYQRRRIALSLSPDSALALAAYGRTVDDLLFPVAHFDSSIPFGKLEEVFINTLKKLCTSIDDPCSMILIKNALLEVEQINRRLQREGKLFKASFDYWPFDSNVSTEESGMEEDSQNGPASIVDKKLELFLYPISKCFENASRLNDHQLASRLIERVDLFRLFTLIVQLETGISDVVRRLLSRIIADMTSFKDDSFAAKQRQAVVKTGLFALLRSWALDPSANKSIVYEAIRALKNLDPFYRTKLKSSVGLYYPVWRGTCASAESVSEPGLDVIFVHGVQGGAVHTWRLRDNSSSSSSVCWPADWLPYDINPRFIAKTRIFGVQYHSVLPGLSPCVEAFDVRARNLMTDLEASGVGINGRRLVWVTHSFGGILVKSMLLQHPAFAALTEAVIFLSTPHAGSPVADQPAKYARYLRLSSAELEEIRSNSPHLLELRHAFAKLALKNKYEVLNVCETAPTGLLGLALSRIVVPESSALEAGCGRALRPKESVDHLSTCKPPNKQCSIYTSILEVVNNAFLEFDK